MDGYRNWVFHAVDGGPIRSLNLKVKCTVAVTVIPTQNGFCESFNGRMRDELLNETLFFGLDHAQARIAAWADDYNSNARIPRWAT